jgi:hypothetical protein
MKMKPCSPNEKTPPQVKCASSYVVIIHQTKLMGLKQGSWFNFLRKVEHKLDCIFGFAV